MFAASTVAHAGGSITLTPAQSIQAAINSGNFTEIILSPGTYNQIITIDADDAPLTIRSQDPANAGTVAATILDGSFLGASIILLTSGVGADVVIDGLTIQNGEATGVAPAHRGGAIDCESASPSIRRCVLKDNYASGVGGAFYVNAGNMTIEHTQFINNESPIGGAAYCNNSTVHFVNCSFESNVATSEGGAARVFTGTYSFTNCDFIGNESTTFGGAIAIRSSAMFSAAKCWFEGNFSGDGGANGRGGAIYHDGSDNAFVENSVFWNNGATNFGSSLYTVQNIVMRHVTMYGDTVGANVIDVPAGGRLDLFNSILWDFTTPNSVGGAGIRNVSYSNIEGGYAGSGNIGADSGDTPSFINARIGNFRLAAGSAGIDAGDSTKVPGMYPTDFDNLPRGLNDPDTADTGIAVLGIAVDLGAFEFQPEGSVTPSACLGDLVTSATIQPPPDGVVDGADLAALLGAWGACD